MSTTTKQREEDRQWLLEQMKRPEVEGYWPTRDLRLYGIESVLDELQISRALSALNTADMRHAIWRRNPQLRAEFYRLQRELSRFHRDVIEAARQRRLEAKP